MCRQCVSVSLGSVLDGLTSMNDVNANAVSNEKYCQVDIGSHNTTRKEFAVCERSNFSYFVYLMVCL